MTNEMKPTQQTAVEWLKREYKISGMLTDIDFQAALQIEREKIEKAYDVGYEDGWDAGQFKDVKFIDSNDYFDKTYGHQQQ